MKIFLTKFPPFPDYPKRYAVFEFHILDEIRKKHQFDETLFSSTGNVIFPNFRAVRVFAAKLNAGRDPARQIRAGHLNAMGLIDEIYHYVLRLYEESSNPKVFSRAISTLNKKPGKSAAKDTLLRFGKLFPPQAVYRNETSAEKYLAGKTGEKPHTESTLEELILLYFANFNTAFAPFGELFDDQKMKTGTAYTESISELEKFFRTEKPFGPQSQYIFDLLRAPILASPHSLEGQLEFIIKHWGMLLSEKYLRKIIGAGDLIKEDLRQVFPITGAVRTVVPTYKGAENEGLDEFDIERFTSDTEWMPHVIMLAKNTYVWLDQLSKKYGRPITKLNDIPDEELDLLARWNFTGLWLIGIWERSPASQKIKQITGNPEAVSSAYSLYDYEIAQDLGGEEGFRNLRHRAWQRGIRLAGDMVPNHTGIYSKWMFEHPEYFIQADYKPFPNYQFTGTNLSETPGIDIRIEDGYWSRRDAAVVFQRVDVSTGSVRYIYHGNDGTSMPWNDTAQLDFLNQEVREAVIQMILHVARKFSVIRFDAAMTLTKKHFQRLWYPRPGTGGDIPSRADHSLSSDDFNRMFPNEFWREVVDRINQEMPNTLLLAEAFWLLEGYFVRTLGMHRVYNSAFMHMLMGEENSKYRALIRNTLHFNPEILKRYVNFMSNPDEQTAVAQFGKDDKYFGVAILMVTLPGLPMFAHGQIEGFTEKYGMEYRKAYYNETADEHLIRRHEREIFPVMKRRHLFSQMTNFEMYDFTDNHGHLNENVFAYSNMAGSDRAIICYHNKYEETAGWIKTSVGKTTSSADEEDKKIVYKNLGDALSLSAADGVYYIFRDHASNLEFLRSGREIHEKGMYIELKAFRYHIFIDFREVHDTAGEYEMLAARLEGQGAPDIQEALDDMRLVPVHQALDDLFNTETINNFVSCCLQAGPVPHPGKTKFELLQAEYGKFLAKVSESVQLRGRISDEFGRNVAAAGKLMSGIQTAATKAGKQGCLKDLGIIFKDFNDASGPPHSAVMLLAWLISARLEGRDGSPLFDKLRFGKVFKGIFEKFGRGGADVSLLRALIAHGKLFKATLGGDINKEVFSLLESREFREFAGVNIYEGVWYYSREPFEFLMRWLFAIFVVDSVSETGVLISSELKEAEVANTVLREILEASERSKYRVEQLKVLVSKVKK